MQKVSNHERLCLMKNSLFLILIVISLISISVNAKDSNTTKPEKQEFKSDEDFFRKMAELDKQINEEKAKTKAVMELGKTVDAVAKELGIED